MIIILENSQVLGPFDSLEIEEDYIIARKQGSSDVYFDLSILGTHSTSDDDTLVPTPYVDIEALKAELNEKINQWRFEANQTSFTHQGKTIACDPLSRSDIDGVANSISLTGAFPQGFPGAWKAVDNTFVLLPDVDAFKAMYASMTLQGSINFGRSQELKAAVSSATTQEELKALSW
jgi:hypothetical protein